MTLKQHKLTDPERIFLSPQCCANPNEGRLWCEDDVWTGECEDGNPAIEYVRSDLAMHQASIPINEEATGGQPARWRMVAWQLRRFWEQDAGTSLHMDAADNLDEAATALEQSQKRERELVEELEHFIDIIDGTEETGFDPHVEQMLMDAAETARKSIDSVSNDQG